MILVVWMKTWWFSLYAAKRKNLVDVCEAFYRFFVSIQCVAVYLESSGAEFEPLYIGYIREASDACKTYTYTYTYTYIYIVCIHMRVCILVCFIPEFHCKLDNIIATIIIIACIPRICASFYTRNLLRTIYIYIYIYVYICIMIATRNQYFKSIRCTCW